MKIGMHAILTIPNNPLAIKLALLAKPIVAKTDRRF